MINISKIKLLIITLVVVLSTYFSLPSLFPSLVNCPAFTNKTLSLGLDLKGGASLLLELDFTSFEREQMTKNVDFVKLELRKEGIVTTEVSSQGGEITVKLVEANDAEKVKRVMRRAIGYPLDIVDNQLNVSAVLNEESINQIREKLINQSIEIVRKRVDESATKEIDLVRQGNKYILLQVPGVQNPEHLKSLLGKTAKLTFHLLETSITPEKFLQDGDRVGIKALAMNDGGVGLIQSKALLTGDMLVDAHTGVNQNGAPAVNFKLNSMGARLFAEVTKTHKGKRLAIVLDNKIISAPEMNEPILGGSGIISGQFTIQSANELALLLRAGALPVPLKIVEERSVGPSLGADSIKSGTQAAFYGTLLVLIFMFLFYGFFGLIADIALIVNLYLLIAVMVIFDITLTLPGIAGMVLTLGMAVDANVLIYERIREEIRKGRTLLSSIDLGFKMAFATILDSNITTILAAVVLYVFGSGPVKGFGVTLAIGIICSMFTAVTLSKTIIALWYKKFKPKTIRI